MSRFQPEGLRTLYGGPFSFAVERGECVALSGPSGCGKTLLLRALADLDPADGDVLLDGVSRCNMAAPQWRRQVGWLPAEGVWWFDSVGDHFDTRFSAGADEGPQKDEVPFCYLTQLGFGPEVFSWNVARLSTGEKQRLALFRLLLNEPRVLLLDEPTAALDPLNVQRVEALIANYRVATGAAVLWVSHDPEQIARVADRHFQFGAGGLEGVS